MVPIIENRSVSKSPKGYKSDKADKSEKPSVWQEFTLSLVKVNIKNSK
jgi:hypothetical protein